ncbi:hypothetical protein ACDH53_23815 [Pseudomonas tremae]|uniref:Uncharacterized protein n=1 Tax=Pseudomonas tremae TaxID=200454 RepID=A0ABV4PLS3_9PSED|nr:hypothetical protein [Pseudomonas coronafaciens]
MLARPACQPSALAQQEDQNPRGPRELFQKWALSVEHPVKGWLDGRWLRRGDDREGYAEEYVQGLWVAFKAFGARPADQQAEPVAITELRHIFDSNKGADRTLVISKKLAAQLLADQPATTKVVLPARLQWNGLGNAANNLKASAWNACLDEVTKLNSGQA